MNWKKVSYWKKGILLGIIISILDDIFSQFVFGVFWIIGLIIKIFNSNILSRAKKLLIIGNQEKRVCSINPNNPQKIIRINNGSYGVSYQRKKGFSLEGFIGQHPQAFRVFLVREHMHAKRKYEPKQY